LNSEIKVGDKSIGGDRTFIIAEVGSNHCQDLKIAYESIDAAADAGADAVKFQSINLEKLYFKPSADTINLHKKIDLDESWHKLLKDYCDKKGIIFFSSPTYLDAIDILEEINISLYKLASAQIGTFPQLVKKSSFDGQTGGFVNGSCQLWRAGKGSSNLQNSVEMKNLSSYIAIVFIQYLLKESISLY
jgi:sialic acid synthase SpsE